MRSEGRGRVEVRRKLQIKWAGNGCHACRVSRLEG